MIDLKPGDLALIDWNGNLYHKIQHYYIVEVSKTVIRAIVAKNEPSDTDIYINIPIKDIKSYKIKKQKLWTKIM